MQRIRVEHKFFMGGFLAGFFFYVAIFYVGYLLRLKQLMG